MPWLGRSSRQQLDHDQPRYGSGVYGAGGVVLLLSHYFPYLSRIASLSSQETGNPTNLGK